MITFQRKKHAVQAMWWDGTEVVGELLDWLTENDYLWRVWTFTGNGEVEATTLLAGIGPDPYDRILLQSNRWAIVAPADWEEDGEPVDDKYGRERIYSVPDDHLKTEYERVD